MQSDLLDMSMCHALPGTTRDLPSKSGTCPLGLRLRFAQRELRRFEVKSNNLGNDFSRQGFVPARQSVENFRIHEFIP